MWMPPHTTRPPLRTALSAIGTRSPTGAKMIAASSRTGGAWSDPPAQLAPTTMPSAAISSSAWTTANVALPVSLSTRYLRR